MKVILLQLPVQGHDFFFSHENIPLAPAYLQAIGMKQGIDGQLLPHSLMCYGSDQAILRFISDAQPDMVGMSSYEWNVERSLFLARQIHQTLPQCRVVLGGPEVTPDNAFLLKHADFDIGLVGEGEQIWELLLEFFPRVPEAPGLLLPNGNGKWHFSGVNPGSWPLKEASSPYLAGSLDSHLKGVLWLETVRGCANHCAYCYYHKQFHRLKPFPTNRILAEVTRAAERGIKEIVFLDPCFLKRPGLEKLLNGLVAINHGRPLDFHAECNAEDVTPLRAEKLWKAGFMNLEVGLQSVNVATLKLIHRRFHPQRFLEGVRRLQDYGVEVMVDLIAGLPGDTLADIRKSLDWVLEHEAYDTLMLYPLTLLAATELRQRAKDLGLRAMPDPPYLLTRGPEFTAVDMHESFLYYEKCMGEEISPLEMPLGLDPKSGDKSSPAGLEHRVSWNTAEDVGTFFSSGDSKTYALTVSLSQQMLGQPSAWVCTLRDHLKRNPFSLISIEVPADVLPEQLDPLWQLAGEHEHLVDRDYTVTHTPYRSFLIFSRARGLIWKWPDPRESRPVVLSDGQEIPSRPVCSVAAPEGTSYGWLADHVARRYPSPPEIHLWEPPDDNDNSKPGKSEYKRIK